MIVVHVASLGAVDAAAAMVADLVDQYEAGVVDTLFTEIRDGGRYSPGTPVATGRTRNAWARTEGPDGHAITNPLPQAAVLEGGSSDQAPSGYLRLAVDAAPLIAEDVARQVVGSAHA